MALPATGGLELDDLRGSHQSKPFYEMHFYLHPKLMSVTPQTAGVWFAIVVNKITIINYHISYLLGYIKREYKLT